MADLNIALEIAGQAAGGLNAVNTIRSALGGLDASAKTTTGFFGGILDTASKLGMGVFGVKALADGVGNLATSFVAGNTEMETYQTQLGTLMGSADLAKDRLAELAEFGAKTPFELPEVVRAEKVLLGFGLTGEKVFKLTGKTGEEFRSVVGDIAAGTGAQFEEIALNMGKFASGATGEAISRFQEMGIATREQLTEMGVQFSKSGELLSPLPVAMQAITQLAEQKFGGGMEKLSKTFGGQVSTLADNFSQLKRTVAAPIFDVLTTSVGRLNEILSTEGFQGIVSRLAALLAGAVQNGMNLASQAFTRLWQIGEQLAPTIQMLFERVTTFLGALTGFSTIAVAVNAAFGDLIPPELNPLLDAVDAGFAAVKTTVFDLVAAFNSGGLVGVWTQLQAAMVEFAPTGERVQAAFTFIRDAIIALVPSPIVDLVTSLFQMGQSATDGLTPMQALASVLNTLSGVLANVVEFFQQNLVAQTALIAVVGAGAAAWALMTAAAIAHSVATTAVATATGIYTTAQWALNAALTANPIGIVVVALAALAAGVIYAYKNSETFRETVDTAFSVLRDVVNTALTYAIPLVENFARTVVSTAQTVQSAITSIVAFFNNLQGSLSNTMGAINSMLVGAWNTITSNVSQAATGMVGNVTARFSEMQQGIQQRQNAITQFVQEQWTQRVPQDIRDGLGEIGELLSLRWEAFRTDIGAKMASIVRTIIDGWTTAQGQTQSLLNLISNVVSARWDAIRTAVNSALTTITGVVEQGWTQIQSVTDTVLNAVAGFVASVWGQIRDSVGQPIMEAAGTVDKAWQAIQGYFTTAIGAIVAEVTAFGKNLVKILSDMIGQVRTQAIAIGDSIIDGVKSAIRSGIQGVADLIADLARAAIASATAVLKRGSPSRAFIEVFSSVPQGAMVGIEQGTPAVVAAAARMAQQVVDTATEVVSSSRIARNGLIMEITHGDANFSAFADVLSNARKNGNKELEDFRSYLTGWVDKAIEHRTYLLWRFNFEAFKRGEGVKALPELRQVTGDFVTNTTNLINSAIEQLNTKLADYVTALNDARQQAREQANQIAADADNKITDIYNARSLQRQIQMQRDAFAKMQQQQREHFDTVQTELQNRLRQQEDTYKISFDAQLKLSRVGVDLNPGLTAAQAQLDTQTEVLRIGYERDRDIARATTEDQRREVQKRADDALAALNDRLAEEKYLADATKELRLTVQREQIESERRQAEQALADQQARELYVAEQTAQLRQEIAHREAEFNRIVSEQTVAFNDRLAQDDLDRQVARIRAERDARIAGINEALAKKEEELAKAWEKERQDALHNIDKQFEDYQKNFIGKVVQAFKNAGVDIADFNDAIYNDLAGRTRSISTEILGLINQINGARLSVGGTPTFTAQNPFQMPNTLPQSPMIPNPVTIPSSLNTPTPGPSMNGLPPGVTSRGSTSPEGWEAVTVPGYGGAYYDPSTGKLRSGSTGDVINYNYNLTVVGDDKARNADDNMRIMNNMALLANKDG